MSLKSNVKASLEVVVVNATNLNDASIEMLKTLKEIGEPTEVQTALIHKIEQSVNGIGEMVTQLMGVINQVDLT